jgi:23S rRNA G2069 N7-methylase RlmK/C1962 C5-methylase RlmI
MKKEAASRMARPTIRLRLGDCFQILREMEEGSFGVVVCDPPYG